MMPTASLSRLRGFASLSQVLPTPSISSPLAGLTRTISVNCSLESAVRSIRWTRSSILGADVAGSHVGFQTCRGRRSMAATTTASWSNGVTRI